MWPAGASTWCAAGIAVTVGVAEEAVGATAALLHHRRTGRPWWCASRATLDGRIAAPDGTSRDHRRHLRADAHRLRAESGAVIVGPAPCADDPS
jgi:hypothetical protein